jgi:hypothetical protein
MKPWVKEAFQTGLLTPISLGRGEFVLKGTEFTVIIRKDTTAWKRKQLIVRRKDARQAGDTGVAAWDPMPLSPSYVNCSFEDVFDDCPDHIKEKMIYHLDILNRGSVSYQDNTRIIRGRNMNLITIDEIQHFGDE